MNNRTRIPYRSATIIMLATCVTVHAAPSNLCTPKETTIISCRLDNAKTVSMCGSPDAARRYVEYRFGTPSNVELSYRADAGSKTHVFHKGHVLYANNADDLLWFNNGQFMYTLFMPTRGGPGLEVSREGNVAARFECKGGWSHVTGDGKTTSPYITDHGTGDISKFESLWSGH